MDVFDLYAKLSLDSKDYDRSLQNASDSAEQWKTKMVIAAKAVGTAFAGAVSGISQLVVSSVNAFASFQQLEGGVETLFGAGGKSFEDWAESFSQSSDSMQDYIDVARKVINGDFGNGAERQDLLSQAGYDPATVQQMVNNLINGVDVASNISADTISANMQTAEEKYQSLQRAQEKVMENARKAYLTAGLSANDYMNTVTTFSASLIQGLNGDTEKAAAYADRALQDMSDNANKMGTDMGDIMNAYQGFSKQNYTMLDNLKLGYGGTKTEMERLIKDAAKLTDVQEELGISVDANSTSFDNIVNAISVVQKNMGITGTTSLEAATTIEGSTKMMKASWQNMLTAMVTGGDWFQESLDALVESLATWARNIMPAVTAAMNGFAALVGQIVPFIASELPGLVEELLPSFLTAISSILDGILDAFPALLEVVSDVLPMVTTEINKLIPSLIDFILESVPLLIDAGITLLTGLVEGMTDNIETVVPKLTQGIIDMVDHIGKIIGSGGVGLADAGLKLINGLANALIDAVPNVLTQITQLVQDLTTNIQNVADSEDGNILTTATTILTNLVDGLMTSIPTLIPELTSAVAEFITTFASLASENTTSLANAAIGILNSLVTSLGEAGTIQSVMTDITTAVMAIIDAIINVITGLDVATFANACASIVTQLADGIVSAVTVITEKLPELITGIVAWLTNPENLTGLLGAALTIFGQLVADVPGILLALTEGLLGIVNGIVDYFKTHGEDIKEGFKSGLTDAFTKLKNDITTWWSESGKPTFDTIGEKFKEFFLQFEWGETFLNFVKGIGDKISDLWDNIKDAFTGENGFIGKVKSWFSEFDLGTIISDFIQKIKDAIEGAWDSFKQWFQDKIGGLFSGIKVPNWIKKLFGNGEGNAEDTTQMDVEDETLVDMPSNMLTLDYSNLEPLPEEVLASYQTLAEAITAINTAISGGEEGGVGLNSTLSGLPELFTNIQTAASDLADFLSTVFIASIQKLMRVLCLASEDEEGDINAGGGNTLYNAMGSIYMLFQDIWHTSQQIAAYWSTEFIAASVLMRTEAGHAMGAVQSLGNAAQMTASNFAQLTEEIFGAVEAYLALQSASGAGGGSSSSWGKFGGKRAFGGPVSAGSTYLVDEDGPELYSPSRNGYIVSNNDLTNRQRQVQVSVNFNGDVIGDEDSISGYVTRACNNAIREAVYAGA